MLIPVQPTSDFVNKPNNHTRHSLQLLHLLPGSFPDLLSTFRAPFSALYCLGPGSGQEQARNRAGAELRIVKQSREERGQELGRNWGEARNVQDRSLQGARQEYGRGWAEAGAGEKQRERERQ